MHEFIFFFTSSLQRYPYFWNEKLRFCPTVGTMQFQITSSQKRVACVKDKTKLLVKSVCETAPNPCFGPTCVPGFEYVPVISGTVDLPIKLKGKFETHFQ